ncbi:MAG: acyl carrier protein [Clostridiales bacterium]|nr:acyl carrier protein [Clostridiales bacterium]
MELLLEILEDLHPDVDFENCDSLIDENILDSFDIIALISEINMEFGISIPPDEIVPENFNSAKALYDLIERLSDGDW